MAVHAANLLLLLLLLVGLPSAASRRVGPWSLSDPEALRGLTFAGLALGAVLNGLGWYLFPGKKTRRRCLAWFAGHVALILLQVLVMREVVGFDWLKRALRWLQQWLPG